MRLLLRSHSLGKSGHSLDREKSKPSRVLQARTILRRTCIAPLVVAATLTSLLACKNPTEILLDVRTDVACGAGASWKGVAIYVGQPGDDLETKQPTLVTRSCDPSSGEIGTLVITPSGGKDDLVGIKVVAGITRNPEDCAAAHYDGCIVERRSVRYSPSSTLNVVVDLPKVCTGVGCEGGRTCVAGACIDAFTASEPPSPGADGGTTIVGPSVRCGDNAVRCATSGEVCCISIDADAGTTNGSCRQAVDCPAKSVVLNCDKNSDCASRTSDAGAPYVCCIQAPALDRISSAQCVAPTECFAGVFNYELCDDRVACRNGHACRVAQVPGYFWCEGE